MVVLGGTWYFCATNGDFYRNLKQATFSHFPSRCGEFWKSLDKDFVQVYLSRERDYLPVDSLFANSSSRYNIYSEDNASNCSKTEGTAPHKVKL